MLTSSVFVAVAENMRTVRSTPAPRSADDIVEIGDFKQLVAQKDEPLRGQGGERCLTGPARDDIEPAFFIALDPFIKAKAATDHIV